MCNFLCFKGQIYKKYIPICRKSQKKLIMEAGKKAPSKIHLRVPAGCHVPYLEIRSATTCLILASLTVSFTVRPSRASSSSTTRSATPRQAFSATAVVTSSGNSGHDNSKLKHPIPIFINPPQCGALGGFLSLHYL